MKVQSSNSLDPKKNDQKSKSSFFDDPIEKTFKLLKTLEKNKTILQKVIWILI